MGARGSSGGISASKKAKNAIDQKMPQLQGSEKQVSWANTIRENMLSYSDTVVRNARNLESYGTYYPSVEGAEFARDTLVKEIKNVTSASTIIDNRNKITQSFLEKLGLEYDRRKKMK